MPWTNELSRSIAKKINRIPKEERLAVCLTAAVDAVLYTGEMPELSFASAAQKRTTKDEIARRLQEKFEDKISGIENDEKRGANGLNRPAARRATKELVTSIQEGNIYPRLIVTYPLNGTGHAVAFLPTDKNHGFRRIMQVDTNSSSLIHSVSPRHAKETILKAIRTGWEMYLFNEGVNPKA